MDGFKIATCKCCGKPFPRENAKAWAKECVGCWKVGKGYELAIGDKAFINLQEAYEELQKKLDEATKHIETLEAKANGGKASRWVGGTTLDGQRVKDLIKLCHPDRHGNNALSTEVTKWLNSLR